MSLEQYVFDSHFEDTGKNHLTGKNNVVSKGEKSGQKKSQLRKIYKRSRQGKIL